MEKEIKSISKKYNGKPEWNLGGMFIFDETYLKLFELLKENNIEIPIDYVYGSPHTVAEGGRVLPDRPISFKDGLDYMKRYINLGIKCKLSFTNHMMNMEDFLDTETNQYLNYLNNHGQDNGVIVTDDNFKNYIRNRYPNLKITCSVIRPALDVGWGKETVEYYDKLCEQYDQVVISTGKALDTEFIKQLKHRDKLEVIVNSRCMLNCPYAAEHYNIVASCSKYSTDYIHLQQTALREKDLLHRCEMNHQLNPLAGSNLSNLQIQNLLNLGVNKFKLEGRNWQPGAVLRDLGIYIIDNTYLTRILYSMFNEAI